MITASTQPPNKRAAHDERQAVGDENGEQSRARAVEYAAEHVASVFVGPEPMVGGGRRQSARQILVVGIVGRDERRQDREEKEGDRYRQADPRRYAAERFAGAWQPAGRRCWRDDDIAAHARRIRGSSRP
jgi:hypothetical protein